MLTDGFFTGVWVTASLLKSPVLQDSSQDSGRSQQCCHLDSLYPSANFQVSTHFIIIIIFTHLIIIIIIIIIIPLEFFTSALADGFSLEFEWE